MYNIVQSIKIYREGENNIWIINPTNWWDMVDNLDAISHKLFGQSVRFAIWFGTVLIERSSYNMIWNGFDLHHDLKRF